MFTKNGESIGGLAGDCASKEMALTSFIATTKHSAALCLANVFRLFK